MKLRSLALSLSFAVASAGIVAPTSQAQERGTMADQHEVEFAKIRKPFQSEYGLETSTRLRYSGLPYGAELTILGRDGSDTDAENGLQVWVQNDHELWLQLNTWNLPRTESISNTVKFLVTYPDGSTEVTDHTFTVYPFQKLIHSPVIDEPVIHVGTDSKLTIKDLPKDAKVQIVDSPSDWEASITGNTLTVNAPSPGVGTVITYVSFADGSTLPVTFEITAEPEQTTEPEPTAQPEPTTEPQPTTEPEPTAQPEPTTNPDPTKNSSSSSEVTIIALIIGLLGLGGAAAFFYNYLNR